MATAKIDKSSAAAHGVGRRVVEDLHNRVRAEFLEMPGLHLNLAQVQRLCGVDKTTGVNVLAGLVAEGFLRVKLDGRYTRLTDGHHRRKAKASLELEWQVLWTARPNVLVTGVPDAVERSLASLMPHLDVPVRDWTPDVLQRRPGEMKTLVIHDVDALSAEHQVALSAWLGRPAIGRTQVVSTTNAPLFPRVVAGLFLEELYYRLNTLVLGAPPGA